jgi:hypothetical protein
MWNWRPKGLLVAGLIVLGLIPTLRAAWAQADAFTVSGVAVDATAESAAAARDAALAQGHVRAMRLLIERLVLQEDVRRVPLLDSSRVIDLVRDFSIEDERASDVRYLADLTFRFRPSAIRDFLRRSDVRFAETSSKPVLILPIFGQGGEVGLWQENNPWLQVWIARASGENLVPLVAPLGDLADIASIDAAQALAGNDLRLGDIARRYGATDVLITQAVLQGDPLEGEAPLQVSTRRAGGWQEQRQVVNSFRQQPGEDLDDFLARAADRIAEQVQDFWKRSNLLSFDFPRDMAVFVPFGSFADWLEVKRRLKGVASVTGSRLEYLTRQFAIMNLVVVGDDQQVALALAQRDLKLSTGPSSSWRLSLVATPPPAPVLPPATGSLGTVPPALPAAEAMESTAPIPPASETGEPPSGSLPVTE